MDILQPSPPYGNDARRWRVTFTSFANAGDVPLLSVEELPDGTQARVNVTEVVKGKVRTGGRHRLGARALQDFYGDLQWRVVTLSTNLTEDQYKVALQDAFTSLKSSYIRWRTLWARPKARNPAYLDVQRDKTKLYVLFAKGDASKLAVSGDATVSIVMRQASQTQILHDRDVARQLHLTIWAEMYNGIRVDGLPTSHHNAFKRSAPTRRRSKLL